MQLRTNRFEKFWLFCLLGAVFLTPVLLGQAADANLVGTIYDPAGSVIADATVTATNVATNVRTTTMTNQDGQYRFGNLAAGDYELTVSHMGFATTTRRGIVLNLNATATANVTLQVGEVTTTIEVTDTTPLIDTTTAQIGATFATREAIDTPMSAQPKGVVNLSLLNAGVASSGGIGLGEGPVVGGQRPRNNSFNIEGVDNNRKDVTGITVDVPNEAVSQFTVLQNQFSAEFGNGTGGVFNTAIRSGSNSVHGAIYEYFNNRNLNAVDESLKRQGIRENPRFDDNRFGGSIGGPIIPDKLFYYGLFEYNPRGNQGAASAATRAPTAAGYAILNGMPGLSRTNLDVLEQYLAPAPVADDDTTVNGVAIPIGILPIIKPSYTNYRNWVASGDYDISENDRLRVRYIDNNISGFDESVLPALPAFFDGRTTTARLLTFSEFHNFTPTLFNEFRFGYQRFNDDIPAGNFVFPGLDTFPNIEMQFENIQLGPYSTAPQGTSIDLLQFVDNVTWLAGNHTLKFGAEFRKYLSTSLFVQRQRGDYGYSSLEGYLNDSVPDVIAERTVGSPGYNGDQSNFYAFINDDYKIRPNFTVNLGLRWEYKGIPEGDRQWDLNSLASVPGLIEFRTPRAMKTAFAPRIGIAYSPGSSGRTSIRAGFGMAYDKYFDNLGTNTRPPQAQTTFNISPTAVIPNFLASGAIPATAAGTEPCTTPEECRDLTSGYLFDQQLPYSIQWNFGIQHAFANDYTFEVRYLGTRGVHLIAQDRMNVGQVVTPDRFLPTYLTAPPAATLAALPYTLGDLTAINPIKEEFQPYFNNTLITSFPFRGNSIYHGLATEFTRRFSSGFLFKGAYTFSKNIDDSTADLFSTLLSPRRPEDFQNMRSERSNSFLDRRHRFSFNWVWDTPWFQNSSNGFLRQILGNYTFSGTYIYETPQYATVQSGIDSNLNIDSAADRAIVNVDGVENRGTGVTPIGRFGQPLDPGSDGIVAYVANDPTAQYIVAGLGARANGGRQTLPTRPINNWDVEVKKVFPIAETMQLQFAAQFLNLFNYAQYIPGYLNNVQFRDSNTTRINLIPDNPAFNRPDLVYDSNARAIQIVGRFQFLVQPEDRADATLPLYALR